MVKNSKKILELDDAVSDKLLKLSRKHPTLSDEYLEGIRKVVDWAKIQLKKIK